MISSFKIFDNTHNAFIEIQENILSDCDILKKISSFGHRFALITDKTVSSLYGFELQSRFHNHGINTEMIAIESGENFKTRQTKEWIEDQLLEKGYGRDSVIIAFGGGVVTDIAGFVAATYCRGLPLITIPTTFLGMVDASIGGKNGVNALGRKNFIGSFYLPKCILIDPLFLKTLPVIEVQQGLIETIKHGIIQSESLFSYLESHTEELLQKNPQALIKILFESCRIKQKIVEEDEKESGKRSLLNFGHTIAHAIESLSSFQIRHGTAVALGILVEAFMAKEMGYLNPKSFDRIQSILEKYQIALPLEQKFSFDDLMRVMQLDKKSIKRKPRFVLIQDFGSPFIKDNEYCFHLDEKILKKAINWMNHDLCYN